MGDIRGCPFGPAMLKRDRHLFESPGMCAQAHCLQWVQIRDGDVTPFYMTFIHPERVLLLMSVVLVPLLGKLYRECALPLMSVDLVPRVGGVGHQHFCQDHMGDIRGCPFGPAMLKRDRNLFEIPVMCAQAH